MKAKGYKKLEELQTSNQGLVNENGSLREEISQMREEIESLSRN